MKHSNLLRKGLEVTKLVTCSAILVASHLAAAGGGGYGGPSLSGDAVPVQLDRGITLGNARKALTKCMFTGDRSTGRVSLMEQFMRDAYDGYKPNSQTWKVQGGDIFLVYPNNTINLDDGTGRGTMLDDSKSVDAMIAKRDRRQVADTDVTLAFTDPEDLSSVVRVNTTEGFPTIHFDTIIQQNGYDKWGKATDSGSVLKGISILNAISAITTTPLYPVWSNQPKPIPVTINAKEYVQCLEDELQKGAL